MHLAVGSGTLVARREEVRTMRDFALFVGWGGTYPGRESVALEHDAEWVEILTRAKAEGDIEDFEIVLLGPHGGELGGFTLVYGTPEKLFALQMRDDLVALRTRASLDHAKFSVIPATVGKGVEKQYAVFKEALREYEREPALV
jgi:hypothetical protein